MTVLVKALIFLGVVVSIDGVTQDPLLESDNWESVYVEDQLQLFSSLSTPIPRIVQGQRLVLFTNRFKDESINGNSLHHRTYFCVSYTI